MHTDIHYFSVRRVHGIYDNILLLSSIQIRSALNIQWKNLFVLCCCYFIYMLASVYHMYQHHHYRSNALRSRRHVCAHTYTIIIIDKPLLLEI